ncbi:hypothetical protein BD770DRAFT_324206, partial [Pilaira anomala]
INYCANVYERYEVLPIMLVFVVGKFANTTFEKKFVRKANTPYILETQCVHWAKSVNFVSAVSIQDYIRDSMDPQWCWGNQRQSQAQSLESLTFASDLTIRFLYSICRRNIKKKDQSELRQAYDQAINQVLKIVELPAENPAQMLEMSKNVAKELLETMQHQKRKLYSEYDLDQQTLQTEQQKYTAEDFQFIEIISKPNKSKNWKDIFNKGKAKDLFNSYTSANSLKSSYHHAVKRAKNKTNI